MPLEDFIIWVYCWVDEQVKEITQCHQLRTRGFKPALSDAEVITMELIGEFQERDADKQIWSYFKNHWSQLFPCLGCRSQFSKQAQNLWAVKQLLQQRLMDELSVNKARVYLIDGFPLPVSHFKRAANCRLFQGLASYGYCASKSEHYFGFKGHLLLDVRGVIAGFSLTPAHESERATAWELLEGIQGALLLGDKGYLGCSFKQQLFNLQGIELQTPVRRNMKDTLPKEQRTQLNKARRLVETTIAQLAGRFNRLVLKKVK